MHRFPRTRPPAAERPDRRTRSVTRRYAARLLAVLMASVLALQLVNWWSAHRLTDEMLVDQEIAAWDGFADLTELYAGIVDVETFGATLDALTNASSDRGDEEGGEAISWHTESRDVAVLGPVTRTRSVDAALAGEGQQISVGGGRLEHVRALHTTDEQVALRYESDLAAVHTASDRLGERFALIGVVMGLATVGIFFAIGGLQLVRAHGRVAELALRDPLTGLGNHRAFEEDLPRAIRAAQRDGNPLALVVLDVDRFKDVNDRDGHHAGDDTLRALAEALTALRAADRAYRIGGDEFAVLIPGADVAAARTVADRIRAEARSNSAVTLSVGLAVTADLADPEDLWRRADRALYAAKAAGRDTTVPAEATS